MTKSTSSFSKFFREDAKEVQAIFGEVGSKRQAEETTFAVTSDLPALPKAEVATDEELNAWWSKLRAFFRSGLGGGLPSTKKKVTAFPALLAPYRNREHVHSDYPFWMADENSVGKNETNNLFSSLNNLLIQTIDSFAEGDEASLLKKNVIRIVEKTRKKINKGGAPVLFHSVMDEALNEVQKELNVKGDEGKEFTAELKQLKDKLPQSGVLIPFSPSSIFQVLSASLVSGTATKRNELKKELSHLRAKLNDILSVEIEKSPEGKQPKKLKSSFDFAESHLNFDALASVMPEAGSELMSKDRFQRIEKVIKTLEQSETIFNNCATILIQKELHADKSFDWKNLFDGAEVKPVTTEMSCAESIKEFEQLMKGAAEIIAAMRIGQLELDAKYDPQVHGDYFATFDWRSFTEEEMAACPVVVFITEVASLLNSGLSDFSNMLSSNMPVKTLVVKRDARIDYRMNGSQKPSEFMYQQELGPLTISHRNTYAIQSNSISPSTLFEGFTEGITAFSPALFYVLSPNIEASADAYLWTSAAVEGREFPGFTYKGAMGSRWGSRFNIGNNPQPEANWSVHELKTKEETLTILFTFADFAAQDPLYSNYFLIVPPQYWSDNLVPLSDYFSLSGESLYAKVPYIWMVDDDNLLQKAAVAWPVVLACKERLDFWNYLQENGGINNYHVEQAMMNAKDKLQAEAEIELSTLKEEHEKEIEKVRDETANEAMEKLTSMLLDLDTASIVTAAPSTTPSAPATVAMPAEEATTEAPPAEEEEEVLSLGEPWIETPLCTSCNECVNLNDKLFKYNADKLAFIADPKGGPFADIVKAAEKCPVKVIHPGAPLNSDEPNLDDLKKRAEKFN